jgi:hypothetical protein
MFSLIPRFRGFAGLTVAHASQPNPKPRGPLFAGRLPTHGGLYAWEFEKGNRELKVRVEGQLTFNGKFRMLNVALGGFDLAYVPEDLAQPYPGYHLYYPSRRQSSGALALLIDALWCRR